MIEFIVGFVVGFGSCLGVMFLLGWAYAEGKMDAERELK